MNKLPHKVFFVTKRHWILDYLGISQVFGRVKAADANKGQKIRSRQENKNHDGKVFSFVFQLRKTSLWNGKISGNSPQNGAWSENVLLHRFISNYFCKKRKMIVDSSAMGTMSSSSSSSSFGFWVDLLSKIRARVWSAQVGRSLFFSTAKRRPRPSFYVDVKASVQEVMASCKPSYIVVHGSSTQLWTKKEL